MQQVLGSALISFVIPHHQPLDPSLAPFRAEILTSEELQEHARALALEQRVTINRKGGRQLLTSLKQNRRLLDYAYLLFARAAAEKEALPLGVDWLLDNFHAVEEHMTDMRRLFPASFCNTLPKLLNGTLAGYPRVYSLAVELIAHTDSLLKRDLLSTFISAYQQNQPLTIGELWAIPIMFRAALIENLTRITLSMQRAHEMRRDADKLSDHLLSDEQLHGTDLMLKVARCFELNPSLLKTAGIHLIKRLGERGPKAALALRWIEERLHEQGLIPEEIARLQHQVQAANQLSIGNTVSSLKLIGTIHWRDWFEEVSLLEPILKRDPADAYAQSDFFTRDRYRGRIEVLARRAKLTEFEVAEQLLSFTSREHDNHAPRPSDGQAAEERRNHIGYYLVDDGSSAFERYLGCTPPISLRLRRYTKRFATPFYLSSVTILVSIFALMVMSGLGLELSLTLPSLICLALIVIPASELALNLVQWVLSHVVAPERLPKLDFSKGIPSSCPTAVTVHGIFNDARSLEQVIEGLEVRFLANDDPQLHIGLLADLHDADAEELPTDQALVKLAESKIRGLNERYCKDGAERFFLIFRRRVWNERQRKFMGWERKRGKICEFNRFVRGDDTTTLRFCVGDQAFLRSVRYVITLDIDSRLPRESAVKLIGTLAHPLNRPVFDDRDNTVSEGYSIIQPRIGLTVSSAHSSRFAELFSGHPGLDPYTQAVSDIYQDLFDEGSFVGKAIYDVDAFARALGHRVPENTLLSHDLFEGVFARVGLATDIELLDDFPARYLSFARRQHRWVRGDWQLLPWLRPSIPTDHGTIVPSPLKAIELWKILDNLRRSLVPPSSLALLAVCWLFLPELAWLGSLFIVLVIAFPLYARLANALVDSPLGLSLRGYLRSLYRDAVQLTQQSLLVASFLPHQAWLMLHAIVVTLARVLITKRNLLEWETAYHSERRTHGHGLLSVALEMWAAPITALAIGGALVWVSPSALPAALPYLGLWFLAPLIAYRCSQPLVHDTVVLRKDEETYLRGIAHDTWRFFDELMVPEHNYLMPDNLQLVPAPVIADRTSPTNIALSLLSTVAAYDLGFIATPGVLSRTERVFNSLMKLERHRGHFLNWYQTKELRSLAPRYISTVDSGNFIGHLITLDSALLEVGSAPLWKRDHATHLAAALRTQGETLGLQQELHDEIQFLEQFAPTLSNFVELVAVARRALQRLPEQQPLSRPIATLRSELAEILSLADLVEWTRQVTQGVAALDSSDAVRSNFQEALAASGSLTSLQKLLKDLIDTATSSVDHPLQAVVPALHKALSDIDGNLATVRRLRTKIQEIVSETDFRFLYDDERRLFTIGYNLDNAQSDNATYDLLASEARLGSLVAIALGQVPQRHWFAMGRQLADSLGGKALVSWSGTMFEYLMPILVTKTYPDTLLDESYRAVIKAQQQYGKLRGVPWGLSESGYSGVDFHKTYQYRAFGVPGLGLKRGLVEDLVISPYSTLLALTIDTAGSLKNLRALEQEGARGELGFFEAIDYTVERLGSEKKHIVQSLFAHHQGMGLVSIANLLYRGIFQQRFHRDPRIKATELLLQERFPERIPAIVPHQTELTFGIRQFGEDSSSIAQIYTTPHTPVPRTALISNRSYSVMVDTTGSGWSFLDREISLTRWREDPITNPYGTYIFVRDVETNALWSVAYQPTRAEAEHYEAIFGPDKLEFRRRDHGISLHTEITVSAEDNVEIRRVTLTNLTDKVRRIELTSYAEVALAPTRADMAHPAFSKMFIESEYLSEFDGLLFARRPRSPHDPRLYLLHSVVLKVTWGKTQYESSREQFLGRGRDIHNPRAFDPEEKLSGSDGPVLDPIMSLRTVIEIEPRSSQSVVFVTATARDRDAVLHLGKKYHEVYAVTRAFEMALSQSNVELRQDNITAPQLHAFQYLANALFFNVREMRAAPSFVVRNRLTQSGLWRLGISGDLPIMLVTVADPEHVKMIREIIVGHYFLRIRGLIFDIVILNEYPGGYTQAFQEELEHSIKSSSEGGLLDKKGGIFIRTKVQIAEEELILLQALARVTINAGSGSFIKQIGEQMEALDEAVALAPLPKPVPSKRRIAAVIEPTSLQYFNGIGGFSADGREYHLLIGRDRLPPLPWSNVIANPDFGCLVSETGAGYTWCENSRENRLTPWFNDPVSNPTGEAIYIKDAATGEFWSPTPAPVKNDALYQVAHGMGYSSFRTTWQEISSDLVLHGAEMERVKWWRLTLTNQASKPRSLHLYLYLQLTLGIQHEDTARTIVTSFDTSAQTVCAVNHYNNEFAGRVVYVGSSETISSYTCDRGEFIGVTRDLSAPQALLATASVLGMKSSSAALGRRVGAGLSPCAALQVKLDLAPGETRDVLFCMGEAPTIEEMRRQSARFRNKRTADAALDAVKKYWRNLTTAVQVRTPDPAMDIIMNGWLVYQAVACRLFGRSGLYQSGGAFGFRDQLQDCLSLLHAAPELVRRQILLHTSRQFIQGDVQHWWHPPTGRGVRTRISDDLLWLPYVVHRYIEATGDRMILEEDVSFIESSELAPGQMEAYLVPSYSTKRAPIYDHCVLAIERSLKFGPHGLPLIGCGDWNDGMNEVGVQGKGESIWLGWFLCDVLTRFAKVARMRRDEDRAQRYEAIAQQLAQSIEANGWDGEWYLRAYFDNGDMLGSHLNSECQIDSIAQSWGIISGFAKPERQQLAYQRALERLVRPEHGIVMLLTPPFDKGTLEPGYIKGYLPGVRENGGQYTHAACWLIIASALLQRGTKAHELFSMINPVNRTLSAERAAIYQGEPYVLCGDVYSVAPHEGRAGWSWYTGSASWLYQAGLEFLLGISISAQELAINPCIPSSWDHFNVEITRGSYRYLIEVKNPNHVESGVATIMVNGTPLSESRIQFEQVEREEKNIKVEVTLGTR